MKIIQDGDPSRSKTIRRFDCHVCGCIWEANAAEYRKILAILSMGKPIQYDLICKCPCCSFEVVRKENVTEEGSADDGADRTQ